jgi:hypothetical protein
VFDVVKHNMADVRKLFAVRNAHKIMVGKPEGNTPLGIYTRRREDNVNMDLEEIG